MFSKLKFRKNHDFPRLKQVNGLLNLGLLAFGWFNLLLGIALYTHNATTDHLFLMEGIFSAQFWGTYFFLGGVGLLLGHYYNWWSWTRKVTLFLLFSKIVWLASLIGRQLYDPDANLFLLLFFGLATILQAGGYIYFPVYKKVDTWKRP